MRVSTAAAGASQTESPDSKGRTSPPRLLLLAILIGTFLLFSSCAMATLGLGVWAVRVVRDPGGTELDAGGPALAAWPADSAELTIAVSPSMAEPLQQRVDAFNSQNLSTPDGRSMRVSLAAISSQQIVERSLGQPMFQAVAPDSSLWLRQIDRLWADQNPVGPNSLPPKRIGETTRFALSPVVIAVRDVEAGRLGWPERVIGWREVYSLALSDPEFVLSRPGADNIAGLAATQAAFYIGAGATHGLTAELATGEQLLDFVRAVEKTVRRNGASGLTGPTAVDAFITQEQTVIAWNLPSHSDLGASELGFIAIYPREGTFWADHPMALLNLNGGSSLPLTSNQRRTYHAFAQFLLKEDSQIELMRAGFRPADLTIDLNDSSSPFLSNSAVDLSQPNALLPFPSARLMRSLLNAWRLAGLPANFLLVVDASESMEGEKLSQTKATLLDFINFMQEEHDRLGLIGLGSGISNSGQLRRLDGEGRKQFRSQVEILQASGYTGLVDAVLEAHAALQQEADAGAVNVILVLSDGRDNHSELRLRDLQRAMRDAPIPVLIHTVSFGRDANERLLGELARIGGGQFHRADEIDIEGLYRQIASNGRGED